MFGRSPGLDSLKFDMTQRLSAFAAKPARPFLHLARDDH
jgi:hypothetical protein